MNTVLTFASLLVFATAATAAPQGDASSDLSGSWVYRSLRNNKPLNTPFGELLFGEGLISLTVGQDGALRGELDMGGGYQLQLTGSVQMTGGATSLEWQGEGVTGTVTEGWIYGYKATLAGAWPRQTDKTPVLVGQVLRTVAHGNSPAGVTGTFFMVKNLPKPDIAHAPRMSLSKFSEEHLVTRDASGNVDVDSDKRSPEAKARMEALRRGVQVMKSRPPSNPKSWFFQGAIHGVTDAMIADAAARDPNVGSVDRERFWNRCPHNGQSSADFLVWHRAYVYYFERILREASGDPTLSLPYWDYTGGEATFPKSFAGAERRDNDRDNPPRNPLYARERDASFTRGDTQLSKKVTTDAWAALQAEKMFFGPSEATGFAGGVYDSDSGTQGLIERSPHNWLHVAIGGSIGGDAAGLMADVPTAAFDPVFWIHHANIDRLWDAWERMPKRSWGFFPEASWFIEQPWYFYDVDGVVKNERRSFYFNTDVLSVRYDDDNGNASRLSDSLPFDLSHVEAMLANAGAGHSPLEPKVLTGTESTTVEVRVGTSQLDLEPSISRPDASPRTWLRLTLTEPMQVPNVGYEVHLVVNSESSDATNPVALGSLVIFGVGHHRGHGGGHSGSSRHFTQKFDITEVARKYDLAKVKFEARISPYPLFEGTGEAVAAPMRSGAIRVIDAELLRR